MKDKTIEEMQNIILSKLRGMATAQCGIAVASNKPAMKGYNEVMAAMEAGTAIGLIIALRITAMAFKDKKSMVYVESLLAASNLTGLTEVQLKSIIKGIDLIPKAIQESGEFEVNHG